MTFLRVKKHFSVKDDGRNSNNSIVSHPTRRLVLNFFLNNYYYISTYKFFSEDIIDDDLVFQEFNRAPIAEPESFKDPIPGENNDKWYIKTKPNIHSMFPLTLAYCFSVVTRYFDLLIVWFFFHVFPMYLLICLQTTWVNWYTYIYK